jgi:hypothetical protein
VTTGTERLEHCGKCGQDKPPSEFYLLHNAEIRKPCKRCLSEYRRKLYLDRNGIDASYEQVLKRDYGITLADYNLKFRQQAGRCAICRRGETNIAPKRGKPFRLAVDHDHVTNSVRGLLCHRCNRLVEAIEDNHTTLDAVRRYVEEWQTTFANGGEILKEES